MISRLPLLLALALPAAAFAAGRGPSAFPIEPIDIPASIEQGVDMIYIDPEIAPAVRERDALLSEIAPDGADLFLPANPLYTDLRRGLMRYRIDWGGLPDMDVPDGPVLKPGVSGERVALLRQRLGLPAGDRYDSALAAKVKAYQAVHGLKADGVAGAGTIASLNLGPAHYERLVMVNLDRARRLPGSGEKGRYVLVDVGAARLHLFEDGQIADSMKVIVGKPETATPMMAAQLRYASVNPYWNLPPDLVRSLIAPRVIAGGLTYLEERGYDVLSDWTDAATIVDPSSIDWAAVAEGRLDVRVRQRPGPGNSMGAIKFMMPNDFGIYLHDTPNKDLFAAEDRWISNGCVRVEDAARLARWLFGELPEGKDPKVEENVDLKAPVPVYITYLTAGPSPQGVAFRADPYGRDATLMARYSISETASALP